MSHYGENRAEGEGPTGKHKGVSWGGVFMLSMCVGDNRVHSLDIFLSNMVWICGSLDCRIVTFFIQCIIKCIVHTVKTNPLYYIQYSPPIWPCLCYTRSREPAVDLEVGV